MSTVSVEHKMMKADIPNGLHQEAPYDAELLAFEHNGHLIRNPYLSPSGEGKADPQKDYGFELYHSGGGCMALVKRLEDGGSIWLTDQSAGLPDPACPDEIVIGRYNAEGESLAYAELKDVPVGHLVSDYSRDSEPSI